MQKLGSYNWFLKTPNYLKTCPTRFPATQRASLHPEQVPKAVLKVTRFNLHRCVCLVTQSCLTLCDPLNCSLPGFSVHGILQTRIMEWVAMPSSRGSSHPRHRTQVSCIAGRFFYRLSHQGSSISTESESNLRRGRWQTAFLFTHWQCYWQVPFGN